MIQSSKSQLRIRQKQIRPADEFHKPSEISSDSRKTIVKISRNYNRKKCLKFIHTTIFISKNNQKDIILQEQTIKDTYVVLSQSQKCNSQKLALQFAIECDKQKLLIQFKKSIAKHVSAFFIMPNIHQTKQNLSNLSLVQVENAFL